MRIRRKRKACLNCGYPLDSEIYNYCPSCGQENTDTNVTFGKLAVDFVSNVFALDSRYVNSFAPFFIKPGYLTNRFNEGKRASYASPVRLYLIISLFFFFTLGQVGKKISAEIEKGRDTLDGDSSVVTSANLSPAFAESISAPPDTLNAPIDKEKSLAADSLDTIADKQITTATSDGELLGLTKESWNTYNRLKDDGKVTDEMLYDSLALENPSAREQFLIRQIIRIGRADSQTLVDFVTKNLPLLMFIMLPIFALLLKLLYVRRHILYIQHLIHAIHLHCFAYIIYGLSMIFLISSFGNDNQENWVVTLSFLLVSVYAYTSFKRVYRQGWGKTLLKFLLLGWAYSFCLFFGVIVEMIISFLLF